MASSGSFSNSIVSGHYKLKVDWSQAQDVSANTSTITCRLYLINDWSLGIGSRTNTCTIGGAAKSFTSPAISGTGTHSFGTVSQSVSHSSDGTKSITISAVFKIQATISGTYYEQIAASATVTLNTIPRASSVSAKSVNLGTASTITVTKASSSFTHTKDEEGRLIIESEEAEVVKRIYREYLEGASLAQIGKSLEADGILTAAGKARWRPETLKKILQNEKYIGDALLQKTYTVDFLSKKRVKNNGIVPQYYVENSHEPIIPRDLYMQVQEEMVRRANLHSGAKRKKRVYSSKYALSSIVYCSKCGDIYRRIAWNNRGKHSTVWRCCTRVEHGPKKCDAPTIQESDLQDAVVKAIQEVMGGKDVFLSVLKENIREVLESESGEQIAEIDGRLEELQQELLRLANGKKEYGDVADEIHKLREQRQDVLAQDAEMDGRRQRIGEMRAFLEKQVNEPLVYDEQLVRRLVEKITVYEDRVMVEFKSGLEIDVER